MGSSLASCAHKLRRSARGERRSELRAQRRMLLLVAHPFALEHLVINEARRAQKANNKTKIQANCKANNYNRRRRCNSFIACLLLFAVLWLKLLFCYKIFSINIDHHNYEHNQYSQLDFRTKAKT